MYARTSFEQSAGISTKLNLSPTVDLPSPLFSSFLVHYLLPLLSLPALSSLAATLTRHLSRNSFHCHSYAKTPGGRLTNLLTNPSRNGTSANGHNWTCHEKREADCLAGLKPGTYIRIWRGGARQCRAPTRGAAALTARGGSAVLLGLRVW